MGDGEEVPEVVDLQADGVPPHLTRPIPAHGQMTKRPKKAQFPDNFQNKRHVTKRPYSKILAPRGKIKTLLILLKGWLF